MRDVVEASSPPRGGTTRHGGLGQGETSEFTWYVEELRALGFAF
jgi:hypothetical protein